MGFSIFLHAKTDLSDVSEDAEKAILSWISGMQVLHVWDEGQTVLVVAQDNDELHFIRAFCFGSNWHVSQDQIIK